MKKQRRLQIIFSAAMASGQLLSSVSASDQPLQPAVAPLRSVPGDHTSKSGVQPVAYAPQDGAQQTTVDQELQKLFHANAKQPQAGGSNIQLVQMSNNGANQTSPKTKTRKKNGFFRRLFGSTGNKQIPGVGEPAPPIPRPPRITYDTNTRTQQRSSGIAAMTASQSRTVQSSVTGSNANVRPQSNSRPTTNLDTILSDRRKPGTKVEFINPFESQQLTAEQETLLDLDSLIEQPTTTITPRSITPRNIAAQTVAQVKTLEAPLSVAREAIDNKTQAGPFSGYQLDVQETAAAATTAAKASVTRQLPKIVSQQQRVTARATEVVEQATRQLPAVTRESVTATVTETVTNAVPLLAEPQMQLPVVEEVVKAAVPNSAIDTIPLLEEEQETAVALPPIQKVPVADVEPVTPTTTPTTTPKVIRQAPVVRQPTHAEKVSNLESQARREQQAYRIMARTGKTGFKGFCPVSLRDSRELIDSRTEYRARFGLQTYYFSSPEAKSAFEANPTRYAPAAGGSDIVLLVNTSEEESGSLDFSLWYRDRLYLFRSRETRRIFADNPTRYANQY